MSEYCLKKISIKDAVIEAANKQMRERVAKAIREKDFKYLKYDKDDSHFDIIVDEVIANYVKPTSKQRIMWITFTKSHVCKMDDFVSAIKGLKQLRLMEEKVKYCFEATTYEDNVYGNIHCHYLCMKQVGINKAAYLKRLEKTLKDKVFNINIQVYTADFYDDKISYMQGKKDDDQYEKPLITNAMRDFYKLDSIY